MKARIHIFYKDGVFDPQGNTVATSLKQMGFGRVKNVRMGKVIDVELDEAAKEEIDSDLQRMCEDLLANPIIESFKFEHIEKT